LEDDRKFPELEELTEPPGELDADRRVVAFLLLPGSALDMEPTLT
jgi:hypothetical protein